MDWKKEYSVSDLFNRRRAPRQPALPATDETAPEGTSGQPASASREREPSMWKKEIKLSALFRRRRPETPRQQLALPVPGSTVADAPTPEASRLSESAAPAGGAGTPAAGAQPAPSADSPGASTPSVQPAGTAQASSETPPPGGSPQPTQAGETGPARPQEATRPSGPERRPEPEKPQRTEPRSRRADKKLPAVPLMRSLNLAPQDVKLAKASIRPVFAHVAVFAVALLVAGGLGALYYTKHEEVLDRKSTIEDKKAEIAALKAKQLDTDDGGSALAGEALARATALSAALQHRVGWDRILRELSLTLPENVWFENVQTATSTTPVVPVGGDANTAAPATPSVTTASTLTISGYAMDQATVAQLLSRLAAIPSLSSVQLNSADQVEVGEVEVIQFSVVGALK